MTIVLSSDDLNEFSKALLLLFSHLVLEHVRDGTVGVGLVDLSDVHSLGAVVFLEGFGVEVADLGAGDDILSNLFGVLLVKLLVALD